MSNAKYDSFLLFSDDLIYLVLREYILSFSFYEIITQWKTLMITFSYAGLLLSASYGEDLFTFSFKFHLFELISILIRFIFANNSHKY